jgi:hypothetical protein
MGSIIGIRSGTEEVPYEVVQADGDFEIRQYGERVVIETLIRNSQDLGEQRGFSTLASFIFGQNDSRKKIAMTSPVEVRPNDQGRYDLNNAQESLLKPNGGMIMRFTLPHGMKLTDVPRPVSSNVGVTTAAPQRFAAVRFSGSWSEAAFEHHAKSLLETLEAKTNHKAIGPVVSMRYDPPWTISCFRRNEVAVEVAQVAPSTTVAAT